MQPPPLQRPWMVCARPHRPQPRPSVNAGEERRNQWISLLPRATFDSMIADNPQPALPKHSTTLIAQKEKTYMIRRNTWKLTIALAAVVALGTAGPAWSHGPTRGELGGHGLSDGGLGGPSLLGARPGGHAGGLLQELIYPCLGDCISAAHTCADNADSDALTCITAACAAEIETAQTACAADPKAQACLNTIVALKTCASSQTCLTTRQTALTDCRTAAASCRQACATPTPTPAP
jgi:hypothetical protein